MYSNFISINSKGSHKLFKKKNNKISTISTKKLIISDSNTSSSLFKNLDKNSFFFIKQHNEEDNDNENKKKEEEEKEKETFDYKKFFDIKNQYYESTYLLLTKCNTKNEIDNFIKHFIIFISKINDYIKNNKMFKTKLLIKFFTKKFFIIVNKNSESPSLELLEEAIFSINCKNFIYYRDNNNFKNFDILNFNKSKKIINNNIINDIELINKPKRDFDIVNKIIELIKDKKFPFLKKVVGLIDIGNLYHGCLLNISNKLCNCSFEFNHVEKLSEIIYNISTVYENSMSNIKPSSFYSSSLQNNDTLFILSHYPKINNVQELLWVGNFIKNLKNGFINLNMSIVENLMISFNIVVKKIKEISKTFNISIKENEVKNILLKLEKEEEEEEDNNNNDNNIIDYNKMKKNPLVIKKVDIKNCQKYISSLIKIMSIYEINNIIEFNMEFDHILMTDFPEDSKNLYENIIQFLKIQDNIKVLCISKTRNFQDNIIDYINFNDFYNSLYGKSIRSIHFSNIPFNKQDIEEFIDFIKKSYVLWGCIAEPKLESSEERIFYKTKISEALSIPIDDREIEIWTNKNVKSASKRSRDNDDEEDDDFLHNKKHKNC